MLCSLIDCCLPTRPLQSTAPLMKNRTFWAKRLQRSRGRQRTQEEEEEAKIKLTFPCVLISIRRAESKGIQFQKAHRYLRPCYHM